MGDPQELQDFARWLDQIDPEDFVAWPHEDQLEMDWSEDDWAAADAEEWAQDHVGEVITYLLLEHGWHKGALRGLLLGTLEGILRGLAKEGWTPEDA